MAHRKALAALLGLASGCVHARDFRSPSGRITRATAYTDHARVRVDVDALDLTPHRLVFNAGISATAIRSRLSFSLNAAHAAVGALSVGSKFTLVDRRWYALGGSAELLYLNPRSLWVLRPALREELGRLHVVSLPVQLWNSFPVLHWLQLHLGVGYQHATVLGGIAGGQLVADADLAQRSLDLMPHLHFVVGQRVALLAGARLPMFRQVVSAVNAEVETQPGVRVGLRSVEWIRLAPVSSWTLEFAAQTRFGATTHLRAGINVSAFRPLQLLVVSPSLSLFWRFR